jgi:hypothetical protein
VSRAQRTAEMTFDFIACLRMIDRLVNRLRDGQRMVQMPNVVVEGGRAGKFKARYLLFVVVSSECSVKSINFGI